MDAVMQAAGLAKGTFYVYTKELAELETEIGAALVKEIDNTLQPARVVASDPLARLATAMTIVLRYLAAVPPSARLAARAAADMPDVGQGYMSGCAKTLRPHRPPDASHYPR